VTFTEIVREYAEAFAPPGVEVLVVDSVDYPRCVCVGFLYEADGFRHWNEQQCVVSRVPTVPIMQNADPEGALARILAQMLGNLGEHIEHHSRNRE
jgi:hypothetical protein